MNFVRGVELDDSEHALERLRIGARVQIRLADMPLIHAHFLVHDHDGRLLLLIAGEGEVESGV